VQVDAAHGMPRAPLCSQDQVSILIIWNAYNAPLDLTIAENSAFRINNRTTNQSQVG
jgi:hypothetical protein